MTLNDKVNLLLVDDQPAKIMAYEAILQELGENLFKAASARQALEHLLKTDFAVILIDVCMPELDGFQLAAMIRDHPRFQKTAIIFISAIHLSDMDRLRGYQMGAVDYVPVPVVPEVLRAKVKVFAELYRKNRQLERLNEELERRVAERTAELENSHARLLESERARSLALEAGQMGSWDLDARTGECRWDRGQYHILGVDPNAFIPTLDNVRSFVHADDLAKIDCLIKQGPNDSASFQTEARILRPNGQVRWCLCAAALTRNAEGRVVRVSGVTIDITDLKDAEERRTLLVREVDHRARNALAVVQSIVRLTKANTIEDYVAAVEGRIRALSTAHALLSGSRWEGADLGGLVGEEIAPYRGGESERIIVEGPAVFLRPATAQILALVLHELATNAAKYGALANTSGRVMLRWQLCEGTLVLDWREVGGPAVAPPRSAGYGTRVITASVERQMGGRVSFDWRGDGLNFTMSVPLRGKTRTSDRASTRDLVTGEGDGREPATGSRILLVEDEALVGMMMKDTLLGLGFEVNGPYSTVAEATTAIVEEDFHAAILDINLGGERVYPLADLIAARDVPFVFVTGYGADGIESRFAHVPVLQKPIERRQLERIFNACGEAEGRPLGQLQALFRGDTGRRRAAAAGERAL